jgi:hypothetical protein
MSAGVDGATAVTTDTGEAVDGARSTSDASVPVAGASDGDPCTAAGEIVPTPVAAATFAAAGGTTASGTTSAAADAPAPTPAATCASASVCPATAAEEG